MRYNRKFLFGLLAFVFLLACTQTPEQRAKNATVLMVIGNADGTVSNGSGFFIESDKIATNIHVVDSARMVFAVGKKKVYNIEGVTGYDPKRDLVVLKVSGKGEPLELGDGKIDDPIFAVGYPDGGYTHTESTVHGIRESDKLLRLVAKGFPENRDSVLAPGISGGPVLNTEGQVIGVAAVIEGDFGGAIASSTLNELLREQDEENLEENLADWQIKKSIRAYIYDAWADKKRSDSENYEEAIKGFDKAIELYPEFANAYSGRGSAEEKLGQYQAAIEDLTEVVKLIPDDAQVYYNRGLVKLKNGDYLEAIQDFDKALKFNADHAESYRNRGIAKVRKSDPNYIGAIQDYTEGINRKPKDPWNYYYNRGIAKRKSEDYGGTIEDYGKAIELKADFVGAYLNRGIVKAEMPDPDHVGAIQDFNKVIELNPEDGGAYYERGNAKKALGQDEDAKQDYAKAYYYWGRSDFNSGNYKAAIDSFDGAITLDPNYVEAYHYRGDAYRLRGEKDDYQKAILDYDKVVALKSNYTETHVIYNNRGLANAAVDNYEEAIKNYTKAIELKSDYAEAPYNRGLAQHHLSKYQAAVDDLSQAIELKKPVIYAEAYEARGNAKETLGQDENAKEDFAIAHGHWGYEAYQDGKYDEAIKNYDAILKVSPDLAGFYDARGTAKTELGKSKAGLGDLEDALKLYQTAIEDHDKAINSDKESALSYSNRGTTKFLRAAIRDRNGMIEDYQGAIKDFTEAIKRKSNAAAYNLRGQARGLLGYAKANQGNSKEARKHYKLALEDFKEAINLAPGGASYYKGLGLANAALGKAKAAIDAFEKAKQLKPESEK